MKKFFTELTIKIFDFIYKRQELNHKKRMDDLNKKILEGNLTDEKFYSNSSATLKIKTKDTTRYKEKMERLINTYYDEPKKLFDYIKGAKTPIYIRKNASKILSKLNEKEGFIMPKSGLQALYLNLILNKKLSLKTPEMFVISSYDLNPYVFIYQFYNWYCYKMNLSGFDTKSQEYFKYVFDICETPLIEKLSFDEIMSLKTAISRDIEAIEFLQNLVKNREMAKKNLLKIKQGKSVNI